MTQEHSEFLINRFDHYYESVNTKGNFLLAFNTFLAGAVIVSYKDVIKELECPWAIFWFNITIVTLFILSLLSILLILRAIYPFLKSGNTVGKKPYQSLIFFGSIASMNKDEFIGTYSSQTDDDIQTDLSQQVYQLATGLCSKYQRLKFAGMVVYFELFLFIPLLYLIINFQK